MIKIQDLINIHQWDLSHIANTAMIYVTDEFKARDSVPKYEIKEAINKIVINDCFKYSGEAYDYLYSQCDDGDLSEAIESGGETNAVGMAKYYLKKELYNKLDGIEDK